MMIGTHNSWTYLRPTKWWMRMLAWTGRCQSLSIPEQLAAGVRCFDLRIRYKDGLPVVAHGMIEYDISQHELAEHLEAIDRTGRCCVRILYEIRTKRKWNDDDGGARFTNFCIWAKCRYENITFFGGRNLYNGARHYNFQTKEPSIEGCYGSARRPMSIYALWPKLYAKRYNGKEYALNTDKQVKLMDFIQIGQS